MSAVDESFGQVHLAAPPKVLGQRGKHSVEHALPLPLLEAVVARLRWWVAPRKVRPWCSRPQHPQDPVEHVPRISPRPTTSLTCPLPLRLRDAAPDRFPLLVGEVHRRRYKHAPRPMEIGSLKMEQSRPLTASPGCRMRSRSVKPCFGGYGRLAAPIDRRRRTYRATTGREAPQPRQPPRLRHSAPPVARRLARARPARN